MHVCTPGTLSTSVLESGAFSTAPPKSTLQGHLREGTWAWGCHKTLPAKPGSPGPWAPHWRPLCAVGAGPPEDASSLPAEPHSGSLPGNATAGVLPTPLWGLGTRVQEGLWRHGRGLLDKRWQLRGSLPSVVCLKPPSPPTTWVPVNHSQTLPVSISDQGAPLRNKRGSAQMVPAPLPPPGTVPDPDFL